MERQRNPRNTYHQRKANDANVVAEEADIRVLRITVEWYDTEGYALLHPRLRATRSARAFDLSGRAAAILSTDLHK